MDNSELSQTSRIQLGDLVIYAKGQNLKYGGSLGLVIGRSGDGLYNVMWCDLKTRYTRKQLIFDYHQASVLHVIISIPDDVVEQQTTNVV